MLSGKSHSVSIASQGTITFNMASLLPATSSRVYVEVHLRGDFGQASEFMATYSEENKLIGIVDPAVECSAKYHTERFDLTQAEFNAWLQDGVLTLNLVASDETGTICWDNDAFIVLCYETGIPSVSPSSNPSDTPSDTPSDIPSDTPSDTPSDIPSDAPSEIPSDTPSETPSDTPSDAPSDMPSLSPSAKPTEIPSWSPSARPSTSPSTQNPSIGPSDEPSSTLVPTSITDRNDWGPVSAIDVGLCTNNPRCAALGLTGSCCPNQVGVNLACCLEYSDMAVCSMNAVCASRSLLGNCCPTDDGTLLACCGGKD
jgi:hypothetical protein